MVSICQSVSDETSTALITRVSVSFTHLVSSAFDIRMILIRETRCIINSEKITDYSAKGGGGDPPALP